MRRLTVDPGEELPRDAVLVTAKVRYIDAEAGPAVCGRPGVDGQLAEEVIGAGVVEQVRHAVDALATDTCRAIISCMWPRTFLWFKVSGGGI